MAQEDLELYQELVPFTNEKTTNKASVNEAYSNPILMPLSFDVTSSYNTVETVLYIRNRNKDVHFTNIAICLLAPIGYTSIPDIVPQFDTEEIYVSVDGDAHKTSIRDASISKWEFDTEYISEVSTPFYLMANSFDASVGYTTVPFSNYTTGFTINKSISEVIDVRFSHGYDEVSEIDWLTKKASIILPSIGNSTYPDNSFIPVRMRLTLNNSYGNMLTLRNFSLHLSYGATGGII